MVTHVDSAFAVHQWEDLWLFNSGCTNHMSPCLDIFSSLDKSCTTKAKIGNGELLAVKGKGTAAVKTISGIKLLENVLYVPEIAYNLLSVGKLVDVGFSLLFEEGKCAVKDCNGSLLLNVEMKNRSFPLYLGDSIQAAYISVDDQSSLMHRRLGHCSYSTQREITRHNLAVDMPSVTAQDCICSVCEIGKSSRASFRRDPVKRAKARLELVHSDVCRPMSTESLKGSKYFLLFVDDYSRKTWCY